MTFQPVVERILDELEEIKQVIDRIKEGIKKLEQTHDSLYNTDWFVGEYSCTR